MESGDWAAAGRCGLNAEFGVSLGFLVFCLAAATELFVLVVVGGTLLV